MEEISVTPSLMLEYLFCPRFVYFMKVQNIPQNEEARFKVLEGRIVHKKRVLQNKDYLRSRISVKEKLINQKLYTTTAQIHGIVDEILFLEDKTAAPLDYKYAAFKERIFKTYKTQLLMYGIMIRENFQIEVNRGYLVFTRSKNHVEEVSLTQHDYRKVQKYIDEILNIIESGYFPKKTKTSSKCDDCCYRNICIK